MASLVVSSIDLTTTQVEVTVVDQTMRLIISTVGGMDLILHAPSTRENLEQLDVLLGQAKGNIRGILERAFGGCGEPGCECGNSVNHRESLKLDDELPPF